MVARVLARFVLLVLTGLAFPAWSQTVAEEPALRVAAYDVAPYVTTDQRGEIGGHSVRFWTLVASELGRRSEIIPVKRMDDVLSGLQAGTYDLAIGAITATTSREGLVDFSHPIHPSGVAVATRRATGLATALDALSATLLELMPLFLAVGLLIIAAGLLAWWLERRAIRDAQPERTNIATIGDGIYWAAVTMTTVGYGDKTPKSAMARLLTVVWMFVALVVISLFTASVTAKLTTTQFGIVSSAETAFRLRNMAAVRHSSGAEFLEGRGLAYEAYDSLPEALAALSSGKVDAVFNSRGALLHHVVTAFSKDINVLAGDLSHAWMAIALPSSADHRETLNRAILKVLSSPAWVAERERMAQEYSVQGKPERSTF